MAIGVTYPQSLHRIPDSLCAYLYNGFMGHKRLNW